MKVNFEYINSEYVFNNKKNFDLNIVLYKCRLFFIYCKYFYVYV